MQSMKILVFSDSHGDERRISRALAAHPDAEGVFFLGDGVGGAAALVASDSARFFLGVKGNCDGGILGILHSSSDAREEEIITLMGYRILLVHGHREGVKGGLGALIASARRREIDVALFGHTHVPHNEYLSDGAKPLYLFNPGSISRPSEGDPSYGVLLLTDRGVLLSHGTVS